MGLVLGMNEIAGFLERWQMDAGDVRRRMYRAPTPRERERWHALWLLHQGWTASAVAEALEQDSHTIGSWVDAFGEGGPQALSFEQSGGSPRADRRAAVRLEGGGAGGSRPGRDRSGQLDWKVVRWFVEERFELMLSWSSCLTPYQVRGDVTTCTDDWGLC